MNVRFLINFPCGQKSSFRLKLVNTFGNMCTVFSTVIWRALFSEGKQLQSHVLCNYSKLEFCFLAQKKVLFPFAWSHLLLSVPFEDIFRENLAIDLRVRFLSMYDIFMTCKCCNYLVIICILCATHQSFFRLILRKHFYTD